MPRIDFFELKDLYMNFLVILRCWNASFCHDVIVAFEKS